MQLSSTFGRNSANHIVQESFGNRVETLRAVVTLLLREVESLEKSVAVSADPVVEEGLPLAEKLERLEKDMIRCALIKTNGRQKTAAKILGMKLTTLNAKIKKYEIDWRIPGNDLGLDEVENEM